MDAVRRDESVLVGDAGKRVIEEVIRSPDVHEEDRLVLIAAIHERLRNMLPVLKDNRAAQSNVAKPPDAAAPSVNEEVAAEIKKARQLEQIAEQAAASEPFPEQADRTIVTFECKPDIHLRVEIGGFKVSVGKSEHQS